MGCEQKSKDNTKIFGLSNWRGSIAVSRRWEDSDRSRKSRGKDEVGFEMSEWAWMSKPEVQEKNLH